MAARTVLFLLVFFGCAAGAVFFPLVGVLGYVAHYSIAPERQWYAHSISHWGLRYSFTLGLVTLIGAATHLKSLQYGRQLLVRHEKLILIFLGIVWLSVFIGGEGPGRPVLGAPARQVVDPGQIKMTKVIIFVMLMTHIITTRKRLEALLWVLVVSTLILGFHAYTASRETGRLESVGGPDFQESNILAAFLATMLPIVGVQFMKSRWPGKIVCLFAGVLATNAIVLTRSRGALVGLLAAAAAAVIFAPRKLRAKVIVGVIVAAIGAYSLMDPQFMSRAGTIVTEGTRDVAAARRFVIWEGSVDLLMANPQGVGIDNFFHTIVRYAPLERHLDAHNTFVRCYSELGIQGAFVFLLLIGSAGMTLRRMFVRARDFPEPVQTSIRYTAYGLGLSLVALLACGLTVTLIYLEASWWVLAMPVCLQRTVDNIEIELREGPELRGKLSEPQPA